MFLRKAEKLSISALSTLYTTVEDVEGVAHSTIDTVPEELKQSLIILQYEKI
jgi:hypothetical protein